jgi:hypothetical protein
VHIFQMMFFLIISAKFLPLSSMRVRCFITTQNFLFHNPNVICWFIKQEATYYTLPHNPICTTSSVCNAPFSQVPSVTLGLSVWRKQLNSHEKPLRSLT